jgi:predicted MFS family arabinose efflux permease
MSSKSAVKLLVSADDRDSQSTLFKWVAVLTGSKNALKGVGFFIGGLLLQTLGFQRSLWLMSAVLGVILLVTLLAQKSDMGRSKAKVKFTQLLSKSHAINVLSLARFFLFGARDVWFVVALPVFLASQMGWSFAQVGGFLACWVIGYGFVQAGAPKLIRRDAGVAAGVNAARTWGIALVAVALAMTIALEFSFHPVVTILSGLTVFGIVFAVNSSVHSYLILAYTDSDKVALNVGFYYMANACGRLVGTLLSGVVYLSFGLTGCLWISTAMIVCSTLLTLGLPKTAH